jgi:hypothetical protein
MLQTYPVRQPPEGKAGAEEVVKFPGAVKGRGIEQAKYSTPWRISALGFQILAPKPDLQLVTVSGFLLVLSICVVNHFMTARTYNHSFAFYPLHENIPRLAVVQFA